MVCIYSLHEECVLYVCVCGGGGGGGRGVSEGACLLRVWCEIWLVALWNFAHYICLLICDKCGSYNAFGILFEPLVDRLITLVKDD